jgi:hypothetical protein
MWRNKNYIFLLICLLFVISCGSTTVQNIKAVPVEEIVNVDNASKALIVAQDIRVSYIRTIKKEISLGIKPSDELDKFRPRDNAFRKYWEEANNIVKSWKKTGDLTYLPEFKRIYAEILNLLPENEGDTNG